MSHPRLSTAQPCSQCGDLFFPTLPYCGRTQQKYCSPQCAGRSRTQPLEEHFWERVDVRGPDDCWPWKAGRSNRFGYGTLSFNGKNELAHRVAYVLTFGAISIGMNILHSCDNPPCCNAFTHLREGTDKDNGADKAARARAPWGENNPNAILTESEVREIWQMLQSGYSTLREIGDRFDRSPQTIFAIKSGQNWGRVTGAIYTPTSSR